MGASGVGMGMGKVGMGGMGMGGAGMMGAGMSGAGMGAGHMVGAGLAGGGMGMGAGAGMMGTISLDQLVTCHILIMNIYRNGSWWRHDGWIWRWGHE